MDPYNASYWVGLAKCRFAAEDSEKAIEACDFALAADETFGEAYAYRGHCYFYLNNSDAAIENYTKAIEYKAFPPEMGYMFLGMAYSNKGAWQEADDCYQRVIDRFVADGAGNSPLLIDTYTNKAVAASQLGKHEEAHLFFEFVDVVDTCHCHYGEFSQMAVYDDRLGVGVTDHADSAVPGKFGQIAFEFGAEIRVFDIVYGAGEDAVADCGHAGAFCSHVTVVINAVEKLVDTFRFGCDAEKASHKILPFLYVMFSAGERRGLQAVVRVSRRKIVFIFYFSQSIFVRSRIRRSRE